MVDLLDRVVEVLLVSTGPAKSRVRALEYHPLSIALQSLSRKCGDMKVISNLIISFYLCSHSMSIFTPLRLTFKTGFRISTKAQLLTRTVQYVNSKLVAVFVKGINRPVVVPVDDHHVRLFARGYLLGLATPFFICLLAIATMNIVRKRFGQSNSEGGRRLQSYMPSFTRIYMKDVSQHFLLNLLMIAPISTIMVILMDGEKGDLGNGILQGHLIRLVGEKGDSGNGLFQRHIIRGCLLGSTSFLFCLLLMALVNAFLERREKMRNSLIEEVQILRNQNLLLRSRLQMEVQRYLDESRHQARSIPLSQT